MSLVNKTLRQVALPFLCQMRPRQLPRLLAPSSRMALSHPSQTISAKQLAQSFVFQDCSVPPDMLRCVTKLDLWEASTRNALGRRF